MESVVGQVGDCFCYGTEVGWAGNPSLHSGTSVSTSTPAAKPVRPLICQPQDDVSTQSELTLETAMSHISQIKGSVAAMRNEATGLHNDSCTICYLLQSIVESPVFTVASIPSNELTRAVCAS